MQKMNSCSRFAKYRIGQQLDGCFRVVIHKNSLTPMIEGKYLSTIDDLMVGVLKNLSKIVKLNGLNIN